MKSWLVPASFAVLVGFVAGLLAGGSRVAHAQAPTVEMRAAVVNAFATLGDNWDGAGAKAVKQTTVDAAMRVIPSLGHPWWPIPSADGSITFVRPSECGVVVNVKPVP